MQEIIKWTDGKKTYFVAAAAGVVVAAWVLGLIDGETASKLLGLLGAGGLCTLRHGISKGE